MAKKRKAKSAQGTTTTIGEVLQRPGSAVSFNPIDLRPKDAGRDKYFAASARDLLKVMVAKLKPKVKRAKKPKAGNPR